MAALQTKVFSINPANTPANKAWVPADQIVSPTVPLGFPQGIAALVVFALNNPPS